MAEVYDNSEVSYQLKPMIADHFKWPLISIQFLKTGQKNLNAIALFWIWQGTQFFFYYVNTTMKNTEMNIDSAVPVSWPSYLFCQH